MGTKKHELKHGLKKYGPCVAKSISPQAYTTHKTVSDGGIWQAAQPLVCRLGVVRLGAGGRPGAQLVHSHR